MTKTSTQTYFYHALGLQLLAYNLWMSGLEKCLESIIFFYKMQTCKDLQKYLS